MHKRIIKGIEYEEKYRSGRIWPYFITAKIGINIEEEEAIQWTKEVFCNLEDCKIRRRTKSDGTIDELVFIEK
tara:strand:+ start:270 stop:488 length:219 start_codon:yes stop_codon:yes gene_type:complete